MVCVQAMQAIVLSIHLHCHCPGLCMYLQADLLLFKAVCCCSCDTVRPASEYLEPGIYQREEGCGSSCHSILHSVVARVCACVSRCQAAALAAPAWGAVAMCPSHLSRLVMLTHLCCVWWWGNCVHGHLDCLFHILHHSSAGGRIATMAQRNPHQRCLVPVWCCLLCCD